MRVIVTTLIILLLAGCSTPQHEDAWRYQAAASTEAYGEHFLKDEKVQIQSNYSHAERSAKQSADLVPLARLYLSECALNRAVLVDDDCEKFVQTLPMQHDKELAAYYAMLNHTLTKKQVSDLPWRYRDFARAYLSKDANAIRRTVAATEPLRSRIVAASLVRDTLNESDIEALIDAISYLGYRRALLSWMAYLADITSDEQKRRLLLQKQELLTQKR
jgi:hypothetical protein